MAFTLKTVPEQKTNQKTKMFRIKAVVTVRIRFDKDEDNHWEMDMLTK
jgi:hypothetical protein